MQFGDTPVVLLSSIICFVHRLVTQWGTGVGPTARWLSVPCYRDVSCPGTRAGPQGHAPRLRPERQVNRVHLCVLAFVFTAEPDSEGLI